MSVSKKISAGNNAVKKLKLKLDARMFKFSMNIDLKKYFPTS
jgi:hypothetical protein